jgi:hypothetical protein
MHSDARVVGQPRDELVQAAIGGGRPMLPEGRGEVPRDTSRVAIGVDARHGDADRPPAAGDEDGAAGGGRPAANPKLLLRLGLSDGRPGCADELLVGVGVAGKALPAVGCFGEQHPGTVGEGGVAGGPRDQFGELAHDGRVDRDPRRSGSGWPLGGNGYP